MPNKSNLIAVSAAVFVALVAIGGITFYTLAASPSTTTATNTPSFFGHMRGKNLTADQLAQLQAKQTQLKTERDAVQAALTANDYNAWVTAVKAIDPSAPILSKINTGNFAKLVEANGDTQKAKAIYTELGIQGGGGMYGFGGCRGGRGLKPGSNPSTGANTTPGSSSTPSL